jgi:hypothetical protein
MPPKKKEEIKITEETKQICIEYVTVKYDLNWYYMREKILSYKKFWRLYVNFWNDKINPLIFLVQLLLTRSLQAKVKKYFHPEPETKNEEQIEEETKNE